MLPFTPATHGPTMATTAQSPLSAEFAQCRVALGSSLPTASADRLLPTIVRFERFLLETSAITSINEIRESDVQAFLCSRTAFGLQPQSATVHNRRTALRRLFRTGRELGLLTGDPTIDLRLPVKSDRSARPLTDAEVERARAAARWSLSSSRYLFVWALAEATARGGELARIEWRHLDLDCGRVVLPGAGPVRPRVGALSEWGVEAFRSTTTSTPYRSGSILYTGDDVARAGRVSASNAISRILIRAGLAGQRDVRPGSVAAWAGQRCMSETDDISAVARLLGVGSLDVAARTIGWGWDNQ